jgi:hypothetical protein
MTTNKNLPCKLDLTFVDVVGLDSEFHGQSCMQHLCFCHGVKENNVLFCNAIFLQSYFNIAHFGIYHGWSASLVLG